MGASASAALDDSKCSYIRGTGLGDRRQRSGYRGARESRGQRPGSPTHPGQRSAAGGTARVELILSVRWSWERFL